LYKREEKRGNPKEGKRWTSGLGRINIQLKNKEKAGMSKKGGVQKNRRPDLCKWNTEKKGNVWCKQAKTDEERGRVMLSKELLEGFPLGTGQTTASRGTGGKQGGVWGNTDFSRSPEGEKKKTGSTRATGTENKTDSKENEL